jgi:hypothetical protein
MSDVYSLILVSSVFLGIPDILIEVLPCGLDSAKPGLGRDAPFRTLGPSRPLKDFKSF